VRVGIARFAPRQRTHRGCHAPEGSRAGKFFNGLLMEAHGFVVIPDVSGEYWAKLSNALDPGTPSDP